MKSNRNICEGPKSPTRNTKSKGGGGGDHLPSPSDHRPSPPWLRTCMHLHVQVQLHLHVVCNCTWPVNEPFSMVFCAL